MSFSPLPNAKFQALDNNGNPLSGGKVFTYIAGTTTPADTYTDSTGGTANTNPIILDARGEADIWLSSIVTYKIVLKDSNDVEIWSVDNITAVGSGSGGGGNDEFVKVTANDLASQYLGQKLSAGQNIVLNVLNPGGVETLEIATDREIPNIPNSAIDGAIVAKNSDGTYILGDGVLAQPFFFDSGNPTIQGGALNIIENVINLKGTGSDIFFRSSDGLTSWGRLDIGPSEIRLDSASVLALNGTTSINLETTTNLNAATTANSSFDITKGITIGSDTPWAGGNAGDLIRFTSYGNARGSLSINGGGGISVTSVDLGSGTSSIDLQPTSGVAIQGTKGVATGTAKFITSGSIAEMYATQDIGTTFSRFWVEASDGPTTPSANVSSTVVNITGDTLVDMTSSGLVEVPTPTTAASAATKDYVDSAVIGAVLYQGTWNAASNTPILASGVGTQGHYYIVSVDGSTNLDGITDWKVGDWAIFNGATWDKVDNTDQVKSISNIGGGAEVWAQLTGAGDAQFRTLVGGSIISFTQNANEITIDDASVVSTNTPQTITGAKNFEALLKSESGFYNFNTATSITSGILDIYDQALTGITAGNLYTGLKQTSTEARLYAGAGTTASNSLQVYIANSSGTEIHTATFKDSALNLSSTTNSSPSNGDIWFDGTNVSIQKEGSTQYLYGMKSTTTLSDLNTEITNSVQLTAVSPSNAPTGWTGRMMLTTKSLPVYITQELTCLSGTFIGKKAIRYSTNTGTTWSAWNEITGGGGGATLLKATIPKADLDTSWSGNTYYTYTKTVTGAEVGDCVNVSFTDQLMAEIAAQNAGIESLQGTVSATDTVKVYVRVTSFITIPTGGDILITVAS